MGKRLCIIQCGRTKIWDKHPDRGAVPAKEAYTGAFAKKARRYAETFFTDWVILSAKHGFLLPDDLLMENYNVSFTSPAHQVIAAETMRQQLSGKGLTDFQEIVVIGGKKYERAARAVFGEAYALHFPLKGCKGIGYMLQALDRAVENGEEIRRTTRDDSLR